MQEKQDIHSYSRRLENLERLLSKLSKENKDIILLYKSHLFVNNLSKPRVLKYMEVLKGIATIIENSSLSTKSLDKLNKEDIKSIIGVIQQRDYSPWTRHTYKVMIRKFICWVKNCEEGVIPDEVKWIKTNVNRAEIKLPGEGGIITKEEIDKAISVCDTLRDKAFLNVLYESGCRIGELASLKLSNLQFDKYGVQIHVFGKTGARRIRLVNSSFVLRAFLESHPFKQDNNSILWYKSTKNKESLTYNAFAKIVRVAFKKAGIKKRCNPHLFRHSRATEMASFLTEFQMNQYFGWTQGSDMPSTYVHMNGKEVDAAILSINGIKEEGIKKIENKPLLCSRCEFVNPVDTKFCLRCSLPLDTKSALALDQREVQQKKIDIIMNELIKEPEIQKMLLGKIRELGLSQEILQ